MVEQKWYGGRVCYESVGVGCGPVWRGRRRASARSSSSSPRPMGRCSALTSSKGGRLGGASHQYETFYTGSVILPTDVGTFRIFEPKYLDMFADLEVGDVFAHSTHERAAPDTIKRGVFEQDGLKVGIMGQGITGERPSPPPSRYPHAPSLLRCRSLLLTCGHAFLSAHTDQKKIGNGTAVGSLLSVKDVVPGPTLHSKAGELEVHYECLRRVLIKGTMGHLSSCLPLDDGPVTGDSQLEIALWKTLCEIQRLEKELGQPNAILPEALLKVCPPPEVETVPTFASRAEHQAAIWQKQSGQVLGPARTHHTPVIEINRPSKAGDGSGAYDQLLKSSSRRQELFAFAAAALVAESAHERLALLTSTSTRGKLEWTLAAARPYLQALRAEHSMYSAIKGVGKGVE